MCAGGNSEAKRAMVPELENPNPRTTHATCKIHVCLRFGPQFNSVFSMQAPGGLGGADPKICPLLKNHQPYIIGIKLL